MLAHTTLQDVTDAYLTFLKLFKNDVPRYNSPQQAAAFLTACEQLVYTYYCFSYQRYFGFCKKEPKLSFSFTDKYKPTFWQWELFLQAALQDFMQLKMQDGTNYADQLETKSRQLAVFFATDNEDAQYPKFKAALETACTTLKATAEDNPEISNKLERISAILLLLEGILKQAQDTELVVTTFSAFSHAASARGAGAASLASGMTTLSSQLGKDAISAGAHISVLLNHGHAWYVTPTYLSFIPRELPQSWIAFLDDLVTFTTTTSLNFPAFGSLEKLLVANQYIILFSLFDLAAKYLVTRPEMITERPQYVKARALANTRDELFDRLIPLYLFETHYVNTRKRIVTTFGKQLEQQREQINTAIQSIVSKPQDCLAALKLNANIPSDDDARTYLLNLHKKTFIDAQLRGDEARAPYPSTEYAKENLESDAPAASILSYQMEKASPIWLSGFPKITVITEEEVLEQQLRCIVDAMPIEQRELIYRIQTSLLIYGETQTSHTILATAIYRFSCMNDQLKITVNVDHTDNAAETDYTHCLIDVETANTLLTSQQDDKINEQAMAWLAETGNKTDAPEHVRQLKMNYDNAYRKIETDAGQGAIPFTQYDYADMIAFKLHKIKDPQKILCIYNSKLLLLAKVNTHFNTVNTQISTHYNKMIVAIKESYPSVLQQEDSAHTLSTKRLYLHTIQSVGLLPRAMMNTRHAQWSLGDQSCTEEPAMPFNFNVYMAVRLSHYWTAQPKTYQLLHQPSAIAIVPTTTPYDLMGRSIAKLISIKSSDTSYFGVFRATIIATHEAYSSFCSASCLPPESIKLFQHFLHFEAAPQFLAEGKRPRYYTANTDMTKADEKLFRSRVYQKLCHKNNQHFGYYYVAHIMFHIHQHYATSSERPTLDQVSDILEAKKTDEECTYSVLNNDLHRLTLRYSATTDYLVALVKHLILAKHAGPVSAELKHLSCQQLMLHSELDAEQQVKRPILFLLAVLAISYAYDAGASEQLTWTSVFQTDELRQNIRKLRAEAILEELVASEHFTFISICMPRVTEEQLADWATDPRLTDFKTQENMEDFQRNLASILVRTPITLRNIANIFPVASNLDNYSSTIYHQLSAPAFQPKIKLLRFYAKMLLIHFKTAEHMAQAEMPGFDRAHEVKAILTDAIATQAKKQLHPAVQQRAIAAFVANLPLNNPTVTLANPTAFLLSGIAIQYAYDTLVVYSEAESSKKSQAYQQRLGELTRAIQTAPTSNPDIYRQLFNDEAYINLYVRLRHVSETMFERYYAVLVSESTRIGQFYAIQPGQNRKNEISGKLTNTLVNTISGLGTLQNCLLGSQTEALLQKQEEAMKQFEANIDNNPMIQPTDVVVSLETLGIVEKLLIHFLQAEKSANTRLKSIELQLLLQNSWLNERSILL
tara:strand:- start:52478 stop:56671 length:4194 start_codon:yes stop_codon:yes gene_type:complete